MDLDPLVGSKLQTTMENLPQNRNLHFSEGETFGIYGGAIRRYVNLVFHPVHYLTFVIGCASGVVVGFFQKSKISNNSDKATITTIKTIFAKPF